MVQALVRLPFFIRLYDTELSEQRPLCRGSASGWWTVGSPGMGELFGDLPTFWRYVAGNLLFLLIIIGGLLLLVIPGIIWSIKYQFAPFLIVDRNLGIKEAFQESAGITSGVKRDLFLFFLLVMGINLVGLLAFAIGLFFTLPATMIAYTFVYRKLLERKERAGSVRVGTEVLSPGS